MKNVKKNKIPESVVGCLQEIIKQNIEILKVLRENPPVVIEKIEIHNDAGMNDSNNISINGKIRRKIESSNNDRW